MSTAAAAESSSLERLRREVMAPGLCLACGACVGLCPHLLFYDGRVAAPDTCTIGDGRCYHLCPQVDPEGMRSRLFAARGHKPDEPLGPVLETWQARATAADLAGRVQYGGVVSTLAALALESGLVEAMALTAAGPQGSPRGVLARNRQEVLAAAGSNYAAGGGLSVLNRALAQPGPEGPLGLVGLPCQVLAAAAMRGHPAYPAAGKRLALVIGLFCTWNLDARRLRRLLAREGVEGPVQRSDIPPPPAEVLRVSGERGEWEIPLERVRRVGLAGCARCPDMTAELADLSVGAREGRPRWNTVLVRTPAGARLLARAREQGLLETEPLEGKPLDYLRRAAANKRARAGRQHKEQGHG